MQVNAANTALCSVAEAAEILKVHPTTALRWAQKGKLAVVDKLSGETGSYVLDRNHVEQVAAEREKIAERAAAMEASTRSATAEAATA
ncbi:helix-turn-helix domain-containing protein [Nocardia wallacei]|uniref:helix-turn-helix domain-containing protein n=1 Tax=Nocardia wallacei TaxID=480035 RepID=UPI002456E655|nr:helix-turn-helix domain-containing protein [Nocardia wallacei]